MFVVYALLHLIMDLKLYIGDFHLLFKFIFIFILYATVS